MPNTRLLPLADQHDYTNGGCPIFAIASARLLGVTLMLLHCVDPRQFEVHDWPQSVPLCLHAFLKLEDGTCLDAEGARAPIDLLRSFGVKRGWKYRLESTDEAGVLAAFPLTDLGLADIDVVMDLLREYGWVGSPPESDGSLSKHWKAARDASYDRYREMSAIPNP